jgi:hypothetical protein
MPCFDIGRSVLAKFERRRRLARSRIFGYISHAEKDMAGSVSPANSRYQGILSTAWWNPRPDAVTKIVTLPGEPVET